MTAMSLNELYDIEGGDGCAKAFGVVVTFAAAGPFTGGAGFAAAFLVVGGMFLAGC